MRISMTEDTRARIKKKDIKNIIAVVDEVNISGVPFVVDVHGVACVAIYYLGIVLRLDVAVVALDA